MSVKLSKVCVGRVSQVVWSASGADRAASQEEYKQFKDDEANIFHDSHTFYLKFSLVYKYLK